MSHTEDKVVYPKLQGAVNYRSWKQNMISLFKRDRAYEIARGEEPKPAKPAYPKNLTKVQYKDRLNADQAVAQAAAQAASSAGSTTVTPQSGESTVAAGAPAQQPPAIPVLSRDDIEDLYQSHKQEWEAHEKWIELDCKAYDTMRRHTEENCQPALGTGTSFEAWSAVENLYRVITYAPIMEAFDKVVGQRSETFKSKAALTAAIQQAIVEFCELASVSSPLMRELEPLLLLRALGPEFYHLKEQVKAMKQSDIDPEKIRSLINGHSVQTVKPSASAPTPPSANLANKNKRKSGQEGQSEGQSGGQSGQSNKRRRANRGGQAAESKDSGGGTPTTKKCNFCDKTGHLEKDCWEKDPSKRPQKFTGQSKTKSNSTNTASDNS